MKITGDLSILLGKYGRYLGSEEYPTFRIHNFSDIYLDRPWTFYEQPEPLTVHYDGGIAIQGIALGQGTEQMSSRQVFELGRDRPLWMALRWQIDPGLDIDYAIRCVCTMLPEKGLTRRTLCCGTRASGLRATGRMRKQSTQCRCLTAELSAGEYELRMVVYNFETLTPTVEIGVWEAETTLARLRLAETQ